MNTNEYIKYIKNEIANNQYDGYVHAFREYKEYLEKRIEENLYDVEATCQLATVYFELRHKVEDSTNIMEELLISAGDKLSSEEKARIYTNLAFHYEDNCDKENCLRCLKEAVKLEPMLPNVYEALGRFYIENEIDENAIELFEKACSLGNEVKYLYNYGVALFYKGNITKAKEVFEKLLHENKEERRIDFAYGVCCAYTGDISRTIEIADELSVDLVDDYVAASEVADLYFLCDKYAKHNEMYDIETYVIDANWLEPYFYSLKVLGEMELLEKKFGAVMEEANDDVEYAEAEELDETFTEEDKREHIEFRQKKKDEILKAYNKVKNSDDKPLIKIKLWFMYGCYLIDCPRHQSI